MSQPGKVSYDELSAKLNLRSRRQRRVRRKRITIVTAIVVVLAVVSWMVLFSSALDIREIQVNGTEITTADEIVDTAQVSVGMPMARIPSESIRQRLLGLPAVAEVELHRKWPHKLEIDITERTLVYQLFKENTYQWVDASGNIFYSSSEPAEAIIAEIADDQQRLLADVATVVLAQPDDISGQISRITVDSTDHIVIYLADGRKVLWGSAEHSAEKAKVLPAVLAQPGSVYDVSSFSHPAIR